MKRELCFFIDSDDGNKGSELRTESDEGAGNKSSGFRAGNESDKVNDRDEGVRLVHTVTMR
jgi:hypothetical protein